MKYKPTLSVGTQVKAGQVIGYVGNTGVGNYHLHLEVNLGKTLGMSGVEYYDKSYNSWRNHYAVNPAQYFPNTNKK
jgi:murein DD-endopeptidase MepM/ murein hydrolase activator NlpD